MLAFTYRGQQQVLAPLPPCLVQCLKPRLQKVLFFLLVVYYLNLSPFRVHYSLQYPWQDQQCQILLCGWTDDVWLFPRLA
ncbi:hypothetical protein GDO81_027029 [Engystomops pustulosus]|uniref:Uncharacterized protein n=1 Tax=Engystomops pustulosus TaxID=76066 RepID=A0AAV6YQS6_ENGPU|nr:hypothetical protein GDO81_027029 [Engystomops pustulosus]